MTSTTRRSIAHRSRAAWTRSDVVVTGDNPADPLLLGDLAGFLDGGALGGTQRVLDAFNALPFAERCLRALSGDIARRFHLLHAVNITVRRPCRRPTNFARRWRLRLALRHHGPAERWGIQLSLPQLTTL